MVACLVGAYPYIVCINWGRSTIRGVKSNFKLGRPTSRKALWNAAITSNVMNIHSSWLCNAMERLGLFVFTTSQLNFFLSYSFEVLPLYWSSTRPDSQCISHLSKAPSPDPVPCFSLFQNNRIFFLNSQCQSCPGHSVRADSSNMFTFYCGISGFIRRGTYLSVITPYK